MMASKIAQLVLDRILASSSPLETRLLKLLRRIILHLFDPLVRFTLRDCQVTLPFSHQLPLILKAYPRYSSNVVTLAVEVQKKYPDMILIDIGANIGDTAILVRSKVYFPIICIEGDIEFFQVLKHNVIRLEDIFIENFFVVGDEPFEGVLIKEGGTAHLSRSVQNTIKNQAYLNEILQRHQALASRIRFLKIDTDGYDISILKAQQALLQASRPIVFFEYVPSLFKQHNPDGRMIFSQLMSLGYQKMIVWDNFGSYMLTLDLCQADLIEDIDHYFSGRFALPYGDIAVFHEQDVDVCLREATRASNLGGFSFPLLSLIRRMFAAPG